MNAWPDPRRLLLHTYNSLDHLVETGDHGVVGVPDDGASSATKANRLQVGDWIVLRITDPRYRPDHLVIASPLRVTGAPFLQSKHPAGQSPWPDLLWKEERETGICLYPFRIPCTHIGTPFAARQIRFEDLATSGLRGKNGKLLTTPSQWGIKFTCNVLDARFEIDQVLTVLRKHSQSSPVARTD